MARESEKAARLAEADGRLRSTASRYYYAAYQAATALLLYRGLTPVGREAWSHEATPQILKEHLEPVVPSREKRKDLADRLGRLYKRRVSADYISSDTIRRARLNRAGKDARYLVKVFEDIISGG